MGCGGLGEDGGCYRRDAWDGYFAGECGVPQDLGGCVEVTDGVGSDDHDCLLWVAMGMLWRVILVV